MHRSNTLRSALLWCSAPVCCSLNALFEQLPPAIHSCSSQKFHDNRHVTGCKHTTSLQGFALGRLGLILLTLFYYYYFFFLQSPDLVVLYFVQDASSLPADFTVWQQISSAKMGQSKVWRAQEKDRYSCLIQRGDLPKRTSLPQKAPAHPYSFLVLPFMEASDQQQVTRDVLRTSCKNSCTFFVSI